MGVVNLPVLILLGVLGIASWIKSRQVQAIGPLAQIEEVGSWIGLVGLFWCLVMLVQALPMLRVFGYAPVVVLIALASVLAVIALSLILALPVLRTLFGTNAFNSRLSNITGKLAPFKVMLG